jgi:MFS family permease
MASAVAREYLSLCILALCWAATLSASAISFTVAPLVASDLGASDSFAPFTNSLFLAGTALVAGASAQLFDRVGRRAGFVSGALIGALGGGMGVWGVLQEANTLVFASSFLVGIAQGLAQFYRFAALEIAAPERRAVAVGLVLSGGFIAAFAGPSLTPATEGLGAHSVGSFGAIAVLHALNALLSLTVHIPQRAGPQGGADRRRESTSVDARGPQYSFGADGGVGSPLPPPRSTDRSSASSSRAGLAAALLVAADGGSGGSGGRGDGDGGDGGDGDYDDDDDGAGLLEAPEESQWVLKPPPPHHPHHSQPLLPLLRRPRAVVSVLVATLAQTVMVGLMSPLGLELIAIGVPDRLVTLTFELHIAAMYGPGVATGKVLQRYGPLHASSAGALLLLCACATLRVAADTLVAAHFIAGMVLCGLGWNLCFASGTLMLASCHAPADASRMQAANDFFVFGFSALGTLLAGLCYSAWGWAALTYGAGALSACLIPLMLLGYRLPPPTIQQRAGDDVLLKW